MKEPTHAQRMVPVALLVIVVGSCLTFRLGHYWGRHQVQQEAIDLDYANMALDQMGRKYFRWKTIGEIAGPLYELRK